MAHIAAMWTRQEVRAGSGSSGGRFRSAVLSGRFKVTRRTSCPSRIRINVGPGFGFEDVVGEEGSSSRSGRSNFLAIMFLVIFWSHSRESNPRPHPSFVTSILCIVED